MTARRLEVAGFEDVVRLDLGSTVAFLAIHMTVGGRSFGGVRIADYPDEDAALADAQALASAMSRKLLIAGLAGGGAKTVVIAPAAERREAIGRLGAYIESLGGRYHCGGDFGFRAEDAAAIRAETGNIACDGLGAYTARSVKTAMEAVIQPASVTVQGLGDVGLPLANALRTDGVDVIATDVRPVAGWTLVDPASIVDREADVFAPCARGGVIDAAVAARLPVRVVCGGANNPLSDDSVADVLHERGIVYVPDFISNVGAVVQGVSVVLGEEELIDQRIAAVGPLTREVVDRANAEDRPPLAVATEMADSAIERARSTP